VIVGTKPGARLADLQPFWQRVRARAGLKNVRIHDLRHTFASIAVASGQGLPMIGKLLGHTQVQTTARYAHLAALHSSREGASIEQQGLSQRSSCDQDQQVSGGCRNIGKSWPLQAANIIQLIRRYLHQRRNFYKGSYTTAASDIARLVSSTNPATSSTIGVAPSARASPFFNVLAICCDAGLTISRNTEYMRSAKRVAVNSNLGLRTLAVQV
jgi:hypothetical protein